MNNVCALEGENYGVVKRRAKRAVDGKSAIVVFFLIIVRRKASTDEHRIKAMD